MGLYYEGPLGGLPVRQGSALFTSLSVEEKVLPAALRLGAKENCVLLSSVRRERTALLLSWLRLAQGIVACKADSPVRTNFGVTSCGYGVSWDFDQDCVILLAESFGANPTS